MLKYEKYAGRRDALGLTDYKMSLLTGLTRSTFSQWKHGKITLKLDAQLKIAKVLKLAPSDIVSKDDIKAAVLPSDKR